MKKGLKILLYTILFLLAFSSGGATSPIGLLYIAVYIFALVATFSPKFAKKTSSAASYIATDIVNNVFDIKVSEEDAKLRIKYYTDRIESVMSIFDGNSSKASSLNKAITGAQLHISIVINDQYNGKLNTERFTIFEIDGIDAADKKRLAEEMKQIHIDRKEYEESSICQRFGVHLSYDYDDFDTKNGYDLVQEKTANWSASNPINHEIAEEICKIINKLEFKNITVSAKVADDYLRIDGEI